MASAASARSQSTRAVYLDDSLRRFETVFPARGSSNSAIDTISKFTCAICSRLFRACVRSFHLA